MEADILKKILLYSAVAVALGLLLTLVPLTILFETGGKGQSALFMENVPRETMGGYDNRGLSALKFSNTELGILAISFLIALVAYALIRFRILR